MNRRQANDPFRSTSALLSGPAGPANLSVTRRLGRDRRIHAAAGYDQIGPHPGARCDVYEWGAGSDLPGGEASLKSTLLEVAGDAALSDRCCAVLVIAGNSRAETSHRYALIIGNDKYEIVKPELANAANDATAIGKALEIDGFDTTVKTDVKRRELYQLIDAFAAKISGQSDSFGLFYYAGHGIQASGKNYLIPVDADIHSEADLEAEAVDAGKVLRAMDEARNQVNIVILDACRDNPLPKSRSAARGLVPMQAPRGTFIGYAAAPGQTAQDGATGTNGVFTANLIKQLSVPGLTIEEVFKRVIGGVQQNTSGKQVPWMESSLQGNFYFTTITVNTSPTTAPETQKELVFWESIKTSTDVADFEDFLKRFPESEFSALANRRIAALQAPHPVPPQSPAALNPPSSGPAETKAAPGLTGYDGTWSGAYSCGPTPRGERGFMHHMTARVRNGQLTMDYGAPSSPGSQHYSGTITAEGVVNIDGQGISNLSSIRGRVYNIILKGRIEKQQIEVTGMHGGRSCKLTMTQSASK